jgi:RNA 2',3'-cyclic 3'-phosphodiesterase
MNPDDVIRSFIAIEISDEVREGLNALQQDLKKAGAKVGWVAPENIHLTLVFLGDIFRSQGESLCAVLDSVASNTLPFRYEVSGTGTFGSVRSPRVIWVGLNAPPVLAELQGGVAAGVRELGLKIEDRPFHPHLTLGRIRAVNRVDELTSLLALAKSTAYGSVEVHRLLLMQSHLEHQGVRYSVLHESALKGAK